MSAADPLLEPYTLKGLHLRNRIMSTSHAPAYVDENSHPGERYQRYHEEKARGGIALTMFGGSSTVDLDSPSAFGQINISDDSIIPKLQAFSGRIHALGAAIMCQISHMGHRTTWNVDHWLPTVAPSLVREHAHRSFPKIMEPHDIDRIVHAYGQAARRCRDGGLDGVELLAHGHLVGQFWNPLVNQRTDEYGGSLENRMRFGLEVLAEIRRQVGDDFIVGLRLAGDEMREGGLDSAQCMAIARANVASGLVDFLNVNGASIETEEALARHLPGMISPAAPFLHLAGAMRRELAIPVLHACRINDIATARFAVAEEHADMIGMTRAHMADPHIVNKLSNGQEHRIRPCVGAGYCIDRIYGEGEALCLHNAATGREQTLPHSIGKTTGARRRVVIVGAGPAGLEAARVSASRGHQVTVFEAGPRPGGQVLLAARAGWRKDLIGIVDWLAEELKYLGVDLRCNQLADAELVGSLEPEVVIVATGGAPNAGFLPEDAPVHSVWDVLGGTVPVGDSVLVFDDNGQHQGPSCAEYLARQGARTEIVTTDRQVAHEMGATNYPVYLKHLYELGVSMTPDRTLKSVRQSGNRLEATLQNIYSGASERRLVDQVVVEHGTVPADELFFELAPASSNGGRTDLGALIALEPQPLRVESEGDFALFRIGDAVASRNIHAAVYDALRLCIVL